MMPRALHADSYGVDVKSETLSLVVLAGLCMFYMAWGIGANDSANNFGTSFGSGALSFRACCCIAAVCEFSGAVLLGSSVSKTFRKGIANIKEYEGADGRVLVLVGMTCVLFSAASWLLVSSRFGLPVSTTHSAVGGVVAFAIVSKGYGAVVWWTDPSVKFGGVGAIVISWVTSPVLSLVVAFGVFSLLQKYVLDTSKYSENKCFARAIKVAPFLMFVTAFVISLFVIYKGAKGVGLDDTELEVAIGASVGIGFVVAVLSIPAAGWIKTRLEELEAAELEAERLAGLEAGTVVRVEDVKAVVVAKKKESTMSGEKNIAAEGTHAAIMPLGAFNSSEKKSTMESKEEELAEAKKPTAVEEEISNYYPSEESTRKPSDESEPPKKLCKTERLFCGFCWITASFEALAHGGNDVANSVGPFAAVLAAYEGNLQKKTEIPVLLLFYFGG